MRNFLQKTKMFQRKTKVNELNIYVHNCSFSRESLLGKVVVHFARLSSGILKGAHQTSH